MSYLMQTSSISSTVGSEQNPININSASTGNDDTLSVSTAFYPGAEHAPSTPDLILMSSENVFFYVHSSRILPSSSNAFDHQWPPQSIERQPPLVILPESSVVVNIVLHVAYNLPFGQYASSDDELIQSVDALYKYGFSLPLHIAPGSELYRLLLSRAVTYPTNINMYALAGKYELQELAIEISPHLLSYDLSNLSDDLVRRMGAIYLRKLVFLHLGRVDALRRLLSPPTSYHPASAVCGSKEYSGLLRAWGLAVGSMVWIIDPAVQPASIEAMLLPVAASAFCPTCKAGVRATINRIVVNWANVKTSI